jgi:gliding motility-associated-like protein
MHFSANTPWVNRNYQVFRRSENDTDYQMIGNTDRSFFIDYNLENNKPYEYFAITTGDYSYNEINQTTINTSLTRTGMAHDDVPPCPPQLWLNVNCDSLYNIITWQKSDNPCADDVTGYILFYSPLVDETPDSLTYIPETGPKRFIHPMFTSLGGHYGISAVDQSGNRSEMVTAIAADTCRVYKLPNVFSPNADGVNDIFHPMEFTHRFVELIHIRIFNRKGELVFETTDPFINWDGTYLGKGRVVPPGVYYYICDVFERRSVGIYQGPPLVGFIHIYTNVESVRLKE